MAQDNLIMMEFCRLCQCQLGEVPVICDKDLVKKIIEVTKIEVTDAFNTYLPTCICISCLDKIIDIYNFIQTVQSVDKNLRDTARNKYFSDNIDNFFTTETSEEKLDDVLHCEKCPAIFSDENLMNIHNNSHRNVSPPFKCSVCLKRYNRVTSYNSHKKNHPELCCNDCNKIFDEKKECTNHKCNGRLNRKKEENLKRKSGRKTKPKFKIKTEISDFPTIPREGDTFQCNSCHKKFNTKSSLQVHVKIHKNFTCNQENCYKELSSAYSLKIHQLNHLGKRSFLCVTCGKSFTTKSSLNCHEKIHSDIKSYKCDTCNIGFSVRSNLRAHVKKYHEGVRFYCSQCTKEFLTKTGLDRHEKIHIGVKEFKCEHCTSAFYTKKELLKHQIYHQGLKLHKCEECFKTFFERHHLIIHLRSHSGERPYVCKIPGCGKSFMESQKLKRHHTAKHHAIS